MTNNDILAPKNAEKFVCILCDFKCCKQCDWNRHILTLKHKNNDKMMTNDDNFTPKNAETITYNCECGRKYKYRQGLFTHKKNCEIINTEINNEFLNVDNKELIITLLKQNNNLQNQIIELSKFKNNSIVNSNII